jgi:hypothetical protein
VVCDYWSSCIGKEYKKEKIWNNKNQRLVSLTEQKKQSL